MDDDTHVATLRDHYAAAARRATRGRPAVGGDTGAAATDGCGNRFGAALYERSQLEVLGEGLRSVLVRARKPARAPEPGPGRPRLAARRRPG